MSELIQQLIDANVFEPEKPNDERKILIALGFAESLVEMILPMKNLGLSPTNNAAKTRQKTEQAHVEKKLRRFNQDTKKTENAIQSAASKGVYHTRVNINKDSSEGVVKHFQEQNYKCTSEQQYVDKWVLIIDWKTAEE